MTHMAHMDETYLHLVTSLLMEKDTLFRADRSDSMTSEDRDDFLPLVSEFLIPQRDRAFSWDVSFEEGLSGEAIQALIAEQTRTPFYKPLPPSNVTGKFPTNPKSAVIEEDLQFMTLFSDNMGKKESLPIKKRKFPEKSETGTKKTKAETRNEKLGGDSSINKSVVPSESDFAKPMMKKLESTVSSNNRQQSPSVASADARNAAGLGKKVNSVVKSEEKLLVKSATPGLHPSAQIYLVPSTSSLNQKSHGVVTTIPPSPLSYQHQHQHQQQMLLPQPSWTDFGVYQSVSADPIRPTLSAESSSSSSSSSQGVSQNRTPLLASDFGPANGIIIGDGCRVGVYTREERLVRIERFREKKLKRIWRKQIKYDCRKRLADTRPRVKGRFVSRIGENGEELPPEPKPDTESVDSKKKKKKLLKSSPTAAPNASSALNGPYIAGQGLHTGPNAEGVNSGDTTQESEGDAGEDAGDSICSDGGDSLSNPRGELPSRLEEDGDHDGQTLEDSLGHIIDIICGDDRDDI